VRGNYSGYARYNRIRRGGRESGTVVFLREGEDDLPDLVINIPYTIEEVEYCDSSYLSADLDNTHLHLLSAKEIERLREEAVENHEWSEPPED
jgi:hypothetical protein